MNLHWSTANVNAVADDLCGDDDSVVISKDAKAVVPTDMEAVQKQERKWSRRHVLPDHTFDQSRTNCVTPMTFLFLETRTTLTEVCLPVTDNTVLHITRSGQAVTLLYLSFSEPETTFRCLNEILFLLTMPALDCFFRNLSTGKLKSSFSFVVDNGQAEQPASSLVQMVMVRLLRLLGLNRITCVSFAEYHSKRNYVERVHAEENRVLSAHGPFISTPIHQTHKPGTREHKDNMNKVAEEMKHCLGQATFGSKPLLCYRGLSPEEYIFSDETQLKNFLALTEDHKYTFPDPSYTPNHTQLWNDIVSTWNVQDDFSSDYISDYNILQNEFGEVVTSWKDKYTTSVYSTDPYSGCRRYELQPLPDYIRWLTTKELHYLPYEERKDLSDGLWNSIPGILLPQRYLICRAKFCLSLLRTYSS